MVNNSTVGASYLFKVETVEEFVRRFPQASSSAKHDRCHGNVHRVYEVGLKRFQRCLYPTTEANVLVVGGLLGSFECLLR